MITLIKNTLIFVMLWLVLFSAFWGLIFVISFVLGQMGYIDFYLCVDHLGHCPGYTTNL